MLFQELKNFKGVLAFMLIPIIGMMMEGHASAAVWTAILLYVALPAFVMMLDTMNHDEPVSYTGFAPKKTTQSVDDDDDGYASKLQDYDNDPVYSHYPSNVWYRPFED